MEKQIYVNLPVKDLNKTVEFFTALGFKFNPQFTDENATCMIISENIFVMLLVEKFFKGFTEKSVADATKTTEVIICINEETREKVDEMVKKAVKAGGTSPMPAQDHGWMYQHGFQDLDGHIWEVMNADLSAFPQQ
ncbi:MAG: VOC family protein [Chitinophagaceae bacterium]|nr:VOC family protein [Chitinophagaceae bacterium]